MANNDANETVIETDSLIPEPNFLFPELLDDAVKREWPLPRYPKRLRRPVDRFLLFTFTLISCISLVNGQYNLRVHTSNCFYESPDKLQWLSR